MANQVQEALKSFGIGDLFSNVAKLVEGFKPLLSIVGKLVKMITLLLTPVADILMIVLLPILLVIKPVAIFIKQFMRPFVSLMLVANREAGVKRAEGDTAGMIKLQALGIGFIIAGVQGLTVAVFSQMISFLVDAFVSLIKPIFDFLPFGDKIMGVITGLKDFANVSIAKGYLMLVDGLISAMGDVDIKGLRSDVVNTIGNNFIMDEKAREIWIKENDKVEDPLKNAVNLSIFSMKIATKLGTDKVQLAGIRTANSMMSNAEKEVKRIKAQLRKSASTGG